MVSLAVMLQVIDPRRWRAGRGERGDIAIIAAIVMPIMILALAFGIDIGHMTYVQRNLQKIADMAAIAGAEDIPNAQSLATGNAVKNGLQTSSTQITVIPGNWNPQVETGPTYFSAAVPTGHQANAVQVQLSESVPYFFFFGPAKTVQAQAIAWVPNPAAGFSLSSTLLKVSEQQSALLNSLLGGLLGIHNLNLGVAGFNGLLNTSVSLGQLAQSIGVGTVNNLLDANLTLPGLFTGALKAVGNQAAGGGLLSTQGATGALQTLIGSTSAQGTIQLSKILKLGLADKNAAVNAQVNLLDLVTASAMLSNQKHFIQIPSLGVNVPGIANIGLGLNVISPPSIAYGEPGRDASGQWRTQAHTAQVALSLQIQLLTLLGGTGVVNIPIYLEVAPAQAHLTSLTCGTPVSQSQVGIGANTGLLTAVIGTPLPNALNNTTQSINELTQNFQGVDLVNVLGLITVHLNHPLIVPLSAQGLNGYQELNFTGTPSQTQHVTTNALGSAVAQTLQALETELQKPGALTVHALILNLPVGQIVGMLLGILNPVLQPILQVLNDVVAPLLNLLGIQVGQAAVNYNALSCGTIPPVLVY
ncbi:MAG: TadG family pilus assembly protein [Acidithiobacillus ferrooxidans]|nr:TadG family pilus assembly protein [Acidithiobacillus ferrooxidans]MDD5575256.1 TadG family pilus assembly protein [Acidithiobacillus sp.]